MLNASSTSDLRCRDIRVRRRNFRLQIPALDFAPGLTLLCGENGAGKSTLIESVVAGESRRMAELHWQGHRLSRAGAVATFRRDLGYVPQDKVVPAAWRVGEYLTLAARCRSIESHYIESAIVEAATLLDAEHLLQAFIGTLSGGWQRRVQIAQALVGNPRIVFMDEPFSGLDAQAMTLVHDHLEIAARNEHRVIVLADHFGVMRDLPHYEVVLENGQVHSKRRLA